MDGAYYLEFDPLFWCHYLFHYLKSLLLVLEKLFKNIILATRTSFRSQAFGI